MSNPIKYSTGSESLALKKGNFYIGTGDVGKGPTSTTGYYNGITPPSGGYTIYLNKATGGPSIYTCANDTELVNLTNSIAGTSYTTANECFVYFAGQTDKIVLNRDYEGIVTDGLVFNMDAGFTPSYPKNGTTWYDVSTNTNNGTLTNGPTFNTGNGGSIVFDGINDYVNCGAGITTTSTITVNSWVKLNSNNNYQHIVDSSNNSWHLSVLIDGRAYFWDGSVYHTSGQYLNTGTWYMLTGVKTLTQNLIYVNGSLSDSLSSTNNVPTYNIWIGQWQTNNRPLNGYVSSVKIYNRALTSSEILQNYNAQKGRFGL